MMRKLVNAQIECNFSRAAAQRSPTAQFEFTPWQAYLCIAIPRVTQGRGHGITTMVLAWHLCCACGFSGNLKACASWLQNQVLTLEWISWILTQLFSKRWLLRSMRWGNSCLANFRKSIIGPGCQQQKHRHNRTNLAKVRMLLQSHTMASRCFWKIGFSQWRLDRSHWSLSAVVVIQRLVQVITLLQYFVETLL